MPLEKACSAVNPLVVPHIVQVLGSEQVAGFQLWVCFVSVGVLVGAVVGAVEGVLVGTVVGTVVGVLVSTVVGVVISLIGLVAGVLPSFVQAHKLTIRISAKSRERTFFIIVTSLCK